MTNRRSHFAILTLLKVEKNRSDMVLKMRKNSKKGEFQETSGELFVYFSRKEELFEKRWGAIVGMTQDNGEDDDTLKWIMVMTL